MSLNFEDENVIDLDEFKNALDYAEKQLQGSVDRPSTA